MDQAETERFERGWRPYSHQVEAWKTLRAEPAQSVVVSSGTGSGKTECFLVPILDSLARQREEREELIGVQALFLYPLNALINSQRDRLRSWTAAFDGDIRFCLYNGQTPKTDPPSLDARRVPQEVMGRQSLRKRPPPILITNSTMLEYMLVRNDDAPIIERSKGKLRWIVLDEAHTYVGSQAAEVALLLRRVLHAFEVDASQVRFVATSATIGKAQDPDTRTKLQEYLAAIAGIRRQRVQVVEGARQVPSLIAVSGSGSPMPSTAELREQTPEERYSLLENVPQVRALRTRLSEGPCRLSTLADEVYGGQGESEVKKTLEILDIARTAIRGDTPLLPLRAHLFHRTTPGVWACSDPHCPETSKQPELAEGWEYGRVYLERRHRCTCGALVFELVMCRRCGAEYLHAHEEPDRDGSSRLIAAPIDTPESDVELEDDDEPALDRGASESELLLDGRNRRRLVWRGDHDPQGALIVRLDVRSGQVSEDATGGFFLLKREEVGTRCPRCGEHEFVDGAMLRSLRLGAAFFLGVSTPALLEHAPEDRKWPKDLPFAGRRIITFSDSRQGTAKFALRSQLEAERNFVRSTLYHLVQSRVPAATDRVTQEARLAQLEGALSTPGLPELAIDSMQREVNGIRQVLDAPRTGRAGWPDAITTLANSSAMQRWLAPAWKDRGRSFAAAELAHLLILREVSRRAMRQNSVETLGLVAVEYPELDRVIEQGLPQVVEREGLKPREWRDFLKLLLDLAVRSNSAIVIDRERLRWMGMRVVPKYLLGPEAETGNRNVQMLWPYIRSGGSSRHRFARLLGRGLGLDFGVQEHKARANDILRTAWEQLRDHQILQQGADGWNLDFAKTVALDSISEAWICPTTRRVLDTTFRGLTPYIPKRPDAAAACTPVTMPVLKHRFPEQGDAAGRPIDVDDVTQWLENDAAVAACRDLGIWTEFSDRLAAYSQYFRVEEHSAQQSGNRLSDLERKFKDGRLNVLSCSTTMEMGVDIGGLSSVAMNNVPPGPSNFLQRAGRAGRRGETAAVSLTMCGATPHGEAVFRDPLWPFTTPINVPRVSLESERIVQRHINALALTGFLAEEGSDALKLRAGWFVERPSDESDSASERFAKWLRNPVARGEHRRLEIGSSFIANGSSLAGQSLARLLARSAEMLESIVNPWREEIERLIAELLAAGGPPNPPHKATTAQLAIDRQLRRMRGEYLLGELASRGFLPGHGFPTGVVPFVNTTKEDLRAADERKRRRRESMDEDSSARREDGPERGKSYPSRELAKAIREYAPGNDVVIDGAVYRSDGVTLNWQIPAGDRAIPELQAFRHAWRCRSCGAASTGSGLVETCEACGSGNLRVVPYLQPSGFAVNIVAEPHNDLSSNTYLPVRPPWISVGCVPWVPLPRPETGRMRSSPDGLIFHHSAGEHEHGYAVCLVCGKTCSEIEPAANKPTIPPPLRNHHKLRGGGSTSGTHCPGADSPHKIKRHQHLGTSSRTDVFELQLVELPSGRIASDPTALSTVAVALRRAAAEQLGIEERELGWAVIPAESMSGGRGRSIVLYDAAAGGAGFVGNIPERLPTLLRQARSYLECPRDCDAACHACLLSYDTQFAVQNLNRFVGLHLLSPELLDALELPATQHYFDHGSVSEYQPLEAAVSREVIRNQASEVRIHLTGPAEEWDVLRWPLRESLLGWAASGVTIRLAADHGTISRLDRANRSALAALAEAADIEVRELEQVETREPSMLAAEIQGVSSVRWATASDGARLPAESWGLGSATAGNVFARNAEPLAEPPGKVVPLDSLRPQPPRGGDFHGLEVTTQLGVDIGEFGNRLWALVFAKVPALRKQLEQGPKLTRIEYTDRYLKSPLTVRLLVETARYLATTFKNTVTQSTELVVTTEGIRPDASGWGSPRFLRHNWERSEVRNVVTTECISLVGLSPALNQLSRPQLGHHRGLTFNWEDGETWHLRLDHGFGFLKCRGRDDDSFSFNAAPPIQARRLMQKRVQLEKQDDLPTLFYVQHFG